MRLILRLPADRMIHNIHNTYIGITVDRRAYAYVNQGAR